MIARARILWRLLRDFDADLMLYRGWTAPELAVQYMVLYVQRSMAVTAAPGLSILAVAMNKATVAAEALAAELARSQDRLANRYPMDEVGSGDTP